jgi:hypothetical protein
MKLKNDSHMKTILNKLCCRIVLPFVFAIPFVSCQKATLDLFESKPSVYFLWQENNSAFSMIRGWTDVRFTFIVGDYDTVRIPVMVMGALADYDRPFSVVVNEDWTFFAREGVHYRILDELSYIPANLNHGFATILAMRAQEIEDKRQVFLGIRLAPNIHFTTDFDSIINNTTDRFMRSVLDFGITISDTLVRPAVWSGANASHTISFWGAYSNVKYRLILRSDIGGLPQCFWNDLCTFEGRRRSPADTEPVALRLRTFLQRNYCRAEAGLEELLVDEWGDMMTDVFRFWETLDCEELLKDAPREPIEIVPTPNIKN